MTQINCTDNTREAHTDPDFHVRVDGGVWGGGGVGPGGSDSEVLRKRRRLSAHRAGCETPAVVSGLLLLGRFNSSIKKWILIKTLSAGGSADISCVCMCVCVCVLRLLFLQDLAPLQHHLPH